MSNTASIATHVANIATHTSDLAAIQADLLQMKADYNESLDTFWMLLATMLVFFMHSGFSLLESGSVRFKNTQNILAKNLIVVTMGFLCWYFIGYTFAFGVPEEDPTRMAGRTNLAMSYMWYPTDASKSGGYRFWLFQGAFCATGATIVSGAMAERTQLKGFAVYTFFMTTVIYPMVVYWGWSGEGIFAFTDDKGNAASITGPPLLDFAGSGLVHLVGGVGALCGSTIVGARKGRFDIKKSFWSDGVNSFYEHVFSRKPAFGSDEFNGHSVPFCVLGTFFLWFGWYGFNAGSTGSMHDVGTANLASIVAVNTTLSASVAGLVVFFVRAKVISPFLLDVPGFCNGILSGLVSITAGCAFVEPWEAIIIGFIGAIVYMYNSMVLKAAKIDDVVDAVPVHGCCGLWGLLAAGIFGNPDEGLGGNGLIYGGDQIVTQFVAGILIIAWVALLSIIIMLPLKLLGALRLSDEFQDKGADLMEHSPKKAYGQSPPKEYVELALDAPPALQDRVEDPTVNEETVLGNDEPPAITS